MKQPARAPADIDRELDALGSVPADVRALIARYAGDDLSATNVDAMLEALSENVTFTLQRRSSPPRLQPTLVDEPAPQAEPEPSPEPQPAAVVAAAEPSPEPKPSDRQSEPRSRLPWESDTPEATPEAQAGGKAISVPPQSDPDFQALFSAEGEADADADEPEMVLSQGSFAPLQPSAAPAARVSSQPPRKRHDTMRDLPAPVLTDLGLSAEAGIELSALDRVLSQPPIEDKPSLLSVMPASFDDSVPPQTQAASGDSVAPEEDEFEILVDDELLEIEEDQE